MSKPIGDDFPIDDEALEAIRAQAQQQAQSKWEWLQERIKVAKVKADIWADERNDHITQGVSDPNDSRPDVDDMRLPEQWLAFLDYIALSPYGPDVLDVWEAKWYRKPYYQELVGILESIIDLNIRITQENI